MRGIVLLTTLAMVIGAGLVQHVLAEEPTASQVFWDTEVAEGDAVLCHLFHSGFLIRTSKHVLVIDYVTERIGGYTELEQGIIDPKLLNGEDVLVFVTHAHEDHWTRNIIDWKDDIEQIRFFVSTEVTTSDMRYVVVPQVTVTQPLETYALEDVEISTLPATDSGVAFLIKIDGVTIYHSGDHATWNFQNDPLITKAFLEHYLKPLDGEQIDIAMHVCDPRFADSDWGGIFGFSEKFEPALTVPMHMDGAYGEIDRVAEIFDERQVPGQLWAIGGRGECMVFRGGGASPGASNGSD